MHTVSAICLWAAVLVYNIHTPPQRPVAFPDLALELEWLVIIFYVLRRQDHLVPNASDLCVPTDCPIGSPAYDHLLYDL